MNLAIAAWDILQHSVTERYPTLDLMISVLQNRGIKILHGESYHHGHDLRFTDDSMLSIEWEYKIDCKVRRVIIKAKV